MPYVGRSTDKISNVEVLDNITFDGSSSYTLQKGGSNFTPSSANTLLLSIDGVVQAGNFTVSGSTIDFGTAVAGTSTCDFVLHYGVGLITAPADGTVTNSKLGSGSFSNITDVGTLASGLTLSDNILFDTASKGIYLGTTSATASNLLDDYEEGTWTATVGTGTVSSFFGKYTKIGDKVFCSVSVGTFSDRSTATSIQIESLPFASKTGLYTTTAAGMHRYVNTGNGGDTVGIYLTPNTTYFQLYQCASNSNWNNVRHDHLSNLGAEFYFNFTYLTN
jgi:hypothetical protein